MPLGIKLNKPWRNKSYKSRANKDFDNPRGYNMIMDVQREITGEVQTESGTLKFDQGIATLPPDTRAEDIYDELQEKHATHPNHFALLRQERYNDSRTHRYFFAMPEMPWRRNKGD